MDKKELTRSIKAKALALGFQQCGVSEAKFLEKEAGLLEQWLSKDMHGKMAYMANNFDKRVDPTKLVDGAKSVISLAFNYYTDLTQRDKKAPKISKYAYGRDYHKVLKKKLKELLQFIEEVHGNFSGRAFVDSGPVLEKAWAAKSGLGWEGKNANMISKDVGSFFFLSELIVDIPLEYDIPVADHCGTCTKCIDACPTEAIVAPYVVDGSKCISYFTIELKEAIPTDVAGKFEGWAFGCDICQDVCPWNKKSVLHTEPEFTPKEKLLSMSQKDWYEITDEIFEALFKSSAVKRTKLKGLKRNMDFLLHRSPESN